MDRKQGRTPEDVRAYELRYHRERYDDIKVRVNKRLRLPELIDAARAKTGESRTQYIVRAVRVQLDADGVTLDSLTERETERDDRGEV